MDADTLDEIIDIHGEHLLKIAYFYVRDREMAKDIVQEVFISFYTTSSYEEQGKMRAFLTKLTTNRCKDYVKSWSYRTHRFNQDWIEAIHIRQDPLILREEKSAIAIAILKLPLKYREIIIFYYYEDYKLREIADILGISENTVKTRMVKAKKLLKIDLKPDYWEVLSNE